MRQYMVHVHDQRDQGRWLDQKLYTGRAPSNDTITADMEVLQRPGRYEVRINRLEGTEEYGLRSWLQGQPVGKIRYARVSTVRESTEGIERYLPANYRVVYVHSDDTQPLQQFLIVAGEDNAGWTMEDYVVPRLQSGMIGVREINSEYATSVIPQPTEADLDAGWEAAWHIAVNGASNPKGVEHSLRNFVRDKHIPIDHTIVRAIEGHLDYLHGNGLGPELEDLREVQYHARRIGITDPDGKYVPVGERKPRPVDPELFARTAPAWNCISHPGEGMHYTPGDGCLWCGKTREQIAAEPARKECCEDCG
jgi:hypothetical protein